MNDDKIIESALYTIDKIRPEVKLGNFLAIYQQVKYLERLIYFAAVRQDRERVGFPIIKMPDGSEGNIL